MPKVEVGCEMGTGPFCRRLTASSALCFWSSPYLSINRRGLRRHDAKIFKRLGRSWIERKKGRKQSDDDEHDKTNAFLSIISTVGEANPGAGQDQNATHPPNGRYLPGGPIEIVVACGLAQHKIKQRRKNRAEDW
jgi:hypothetical protein